MKDTNKVIVIGRLVRDSELKPFNNTNRLDFSMAYTTAKKNGDRYEDKSNFINLSLWGKQAETMERFLKKGQQILIEGHLEMSQWEKDGKKFTETQVRVDNVQLLGGGKKSNTVEDTVSAFKESGLVAPDAEPFPEDMPF